MIGEPADDTSRCSFCDKAAVDVAQLVAGRDARICNGCLGICRHIVSEKIDPIAIARLRIAAFDALKGWGEVGPDGKWASWNYGQLQAQATGLVDWALSAPPLAKPPESGDA